MLFASEVSAVVGENPFRKPMEPFEAVWLRSLPQSYKAAKAQAEQELKAPVLSRDEQVEQQLAEHNLTDLHQQTVKLAGQDGQTTQGLAQAKADFKSAVSTLEVEDAVKSQMTQHTDSAANTTFGTQNELPAVKKFEYLARTTVRENNTKFYKKELGLTHPFEDSWSLGGRIDGFDGSKLVEVKNRTKRFFDPLPEWDLVQFQCYLELLDLPEGVLVENLKASAEDEEFAPGLISPDSMKSTPVSRDDKHWKEIIFPRMESFCDFLSQFSQDQNFNEQVRYFRSSEEERLQIIEPIDFRGSYFEKK